MKAKHSRKYPDLSIGDQVHIYTKKALFDKAHAYGQTAATESKAFHIPTVCRFYHTTARERPFIHHELLFKTCW